MKGMKEMKKMKKLISAVAATAMFLGTIPMAAATETNAWSQTLDSELVHIGVIADTHVIDSDDTDNMTAAFNAFKDLTNEGLSGVIMNGDIVYQYPPSGNVSTSVSDGAYGDVFNALEGVFGEGYDQYIWSMGNHEFPQGVGKGTDADNATDENGETYSLTEKALGFFTTNVNSTPNYVKEFDGYTVIAAAAQDYNGVYSTDTEDWILDQIEEAINKKDGAKKPIFLAMHHPLQGRIMNFNVTSCSESFIEKLKAYPQVINISSHEHIMAQQPAAIRQDGFTSIMTPYLGEIGYINAEGTKYTGGKDYAQALMIEIDPDTNVVKIYKLDVSNKKFIGNPYVIDIPDLIENGEDAYLYTDARKENSNTPAFESGAKVTVDSLVGTDVTVSFPQATNVAQNEYVDDGFVLYYKADVTNVTTGALIKSQQLASGYHLASVPGEMPATLTATIDSLPEGTECKISITPVAPFGKEGTAITTDTFKTLRKGEIPTDGTSVLELYPAQDAYYMTPSRNGFNYVTSLGTESIGFWGGTDADFEVYASEDGWYDIGISATNWRDAAIPVRIFANTERAAKLDVTQTTYPVDDTSIDYFEAAEFWPTATEETIEYKTSEKNKTLKTNGHVWLTKGTNYIRIQNDAAAHGSGIALHKVLIKKNLDCNDSAPTYHYYDAVEYSMSYTITPWDNGQGWSYSVVDNSTWAEAPNDGAMVQGHQIRSDPPFKANYKISVPVSGYYKMTFRGGNGGNPSPYNVYINSSEKATTSGTIAKTGGYLTYDAHDFGTMYLNKGVNLLTLHQTDWVVTYANGFSLELIEEKQLDTAKYVLYTFNADKYNVNYNGTDYPSASFADKMSTGGGSWMKFVVNADKAGWYNVITESGNSGSANTFVIEVNGEAQLISAVKKAGDLNADNNPIWNTWETKLGKVYLNEGANIIKMTNSTAYADLGIAHSVIKGLTFAKANADMYLGNAEISEVANGTLKATMWLGGEKEIGSDVRGIFAIYEDGKLAAISSATKTLEKYCDEIDVTIENFTAQAGKKYTAKAFMWDGTYSGISIDLAK